MPRVPGKGTAFQQYLAENEKKVQLINLGLEPEFFDGIRGPRGVQDAFGTSRLTRNPELGGYSAQNHDDPAVTEQLSDLPDGAQVMFVPFAEYWWSGAAGPRSLQLFVTQSVGGTPFSVSLDDVKSAASGDKFALKRPIYLGSNQRLRVFVSGLATRVVLRLYSITLRRGEYVAWPGG